MALKNKLGLTSSADLAREEERISKKKAADLFEKGILDSLPVGKFSTLQAIHKFLFEDIYRNRVCMRLLLLESELFKQRDGNHSPARSQKTVYDSYRKPRGDCKQIIFS